LVITHKLKMNMEEEVTQRLEMPLGDVSTRSIEMLLYSRQSPWPIPEGVTVLICYQKPDGTVGQYDTMPDGTAAWSANDNVLTVLVAPQVLTAVGNVALFAQMYLEDKVLHTFSVEIGVRAPFVTNRGIHTASEDYYYATNVLRGPVTAQVGQLLAVEEVDGFGRVTKVEPVDTADVVNKGGNAVLYKPQSLAFYEKSQARENIGAAPIDVVNDLVCRLDDGTLTLPDRKSGDNHTLYTHQEKLIFFIEGQQKRSVFILTSEDEARLLSAAEAGKVLYTPQELTADQKNQARQNIGAPSADAVATLQNKFVGEKILFEDGKITGDYYVVGITKGNLEVIQYDPNTNAYGAAKTLLTTDDKASLVDAVIAALPIYGGEVEEA